MTLQFQPEAPLPDSVASTESDPAWVYVGFWPRFVASVIDTLVQIGILLAFYFLYQLVVGKPMPDGHGWPVNFILTAVIIWMWMKYGATPGKMYVKAQVLDARTGQRLRLGQSIIRYLSYFVSAIPLLLGFFAIAWSDKRQGWHDRIAGTVVVRPGQWQLGADGLPELG